MFQDDFSANCDKTKADIFNQYFHSVFASSSCSLPEILPYINSIHSIYIEEYEVYSALVSLDINKATGIDNVGLKILKHCTICISLFQPKATSSV